MTLPAARPRGSKLAALAAGLMLAAAAGCGADPAEEGTGGERTGVGPVRAGSVASLAQCSDWRAGSRRERLTTIRDIREQLNQTGTAEPTSDLNDERAYELLDRACEPSYAAGFRLYKLYARGAAFAPLAD